jgi:RNA polymerase sigma-70 factor (ECF subfamily)
VENREKFREIVEGCIANNRKCQEQLFKLFYGKMLSVCIRYIPDRDSAQEVLQEGFIKVFDKIGAFDHKGSLEGWVRRIVVNTAIDHIRKSKKDPFRTDQDDDFKLGASDPMPPT